MTLLILELSAYSNVDFVFNVKCVDYINYTITQTHRHAIAGAYKDIMKDRMYTLAELVIIEVHTLSTNCFLRRPLTSKPAHSSDNSMGWIDGGCTQNDAFIFTIKQSFDS